MSFVDHISGSLFNPNLKAYFKYADMQETSLCLLSRIIEIREFSIRKYKPALLWSELEQESLRTYYKLNFVLLMQGPQHLRIFMIAE